MKNYNGNVNGNVNKLINLLSRVSKKGKGKGRRNRKSRIPYTLSTRPVKLGPGKTFRVINQEYSADSDNVYRIPIYQVLLNSGEFANIGTQFRYFKVDWIKLIFFANNSVDDPKRIFINLSWFANQYSYSDLKKDDSTKMIPAFLTRNKVLTYLPPNMVMKFESEIQSPPLNYINPSAWNSTTRNDLQNGFPGWLYVANDSDHSVYFEIQIGVRFRSSDFGTINKKSIPKEELYKVIHFKIIKEDNPLGNEELGVPNIEEEKKYKEDEDKKEDIKEEEIKDKKKSKKEIKKEERMERKERRKEKKREKKERNEERNNLIKNIIDNLKVVDEEVSESETDTEKKDEEFGLVLGEDIKKIKINPEEFKVKTD